VLVIAAVYGANNTWRQAAGRSAIRRGGFSFG
jgi:hypothetical protein